MLICVLSHSVLFLTIACKSTNKSLISACTLRLAFLELSLLETNRHAVRTLKLTTEISETVWKENLEDEPQLRSLLNVTVVDLCGTDLPS